MLEWSEVAALGVLNSGTMTIADGEEITQKFSIKGPVMWLDIESDGVITVSGWIFDRTEGDGGFTTERAGGGSTVADTTTVNGSLPMGGNPIPLADVKGKTPEVTFHNASGAARTVHFWIGSQHKGDGV